MTHVHNLKVNKTKIKEQLLREFQEYVREAEHQEGRSFWRDNFTTCHEALVDFTLYFTSKHKILSGEPK